MSETERLVYLLIVLLIASPGLIYAFRQRGALRNAVIWLVLFTALVMGYNAYQQRQIEADPDAGYQTAPEAPASSEPAPVRNL